MTIYISLKKSNDCFRIKILGHQNLELSFKISGDDDIKEYGRALLYTLDFLQTNAEIVFFSDNVMTTNMLNYWIKYNNQTTETPACILDKSWEMVRDLIQKKNIQFHAYTSY